jgi:radical SAM superfamily enzyme YgiQ (UPF0313 family)
MDPVECIDLLHQRGLWVTGGFIVGFDSDTEEIFEQQVQFVERTAIPWALLNSLHAMPGTALYARMMREDRLLEARNSSGDATPPNFRTFMDPQTLVAGLATTVATLYEPQRFFERAWRSLEQWETQKSQRAPRRPGIPAVLGILARSIWHQGLRSSYRKTYWVYFLKVLGRYGLNRPKMWLACMIMISGHHFIPYASELVQRIKMAEVMLRAETPLEAIPAAMGE